MAVNFPTALRRERSLVLLAIGALCLHIADDNFLQPEPGTSAAGHLASGLVPLALLFAAAASYGRLRAGPRAALALVLGVLGVLVGTEAVYYAATGAMSGDDYTGIVSIAAGTLLLVVGMVTLWRSRRRAGNRWWRYGRRLLLTVAAALVVMLALFPICLSYVVTHTARAKVPAAALGARYEAVEFTTSDGLRLKGWYIPSKNHAAVIAIPGRSGPQRQARMLARHGYGVLLFDRRGEGESDGDPNVFGWQGERDVHAAIAFLQRRDDVDPERIGGIGLSVGGEMLIEAAAESDALKAIVSEGGSGRSVRDDVANTDRAAEKVAAIVQAGVTVSTAVLTNNLPPTSLKSLVPRIAPRSVFFIYALHGQNGTEKRPNRGFYAAAGEPKQIWEVPEGPHIGGIAARPVEYERRVIAFFDRALLSDHGAGVPRPADRASAASSAYGER
jgi:dienelactone hydrolase